MMDSFITDPAAIRQLKAEQTAYRIDTPDQGDPNSRQFWQETIIVFANKDGQRGLFYPKTVMFDDLFKSFKHNQDPYLFWANEVDCDLEENPPTVEKLIQDILGYPPLSVG